jgi:hypothetical protein
MVGQRLRNHILKNGLLVAAIGSAAGGFAGGTLGSALEGKKFGEVIGNWIWCGRFYRIQICQN